jgi:hypothetical protein
MNGNEKINPAVRNKELEKTVINPADERPHSRNYAR